MKAMFTDTEERNPQLALILLGAGATFGTLLVVVPSHLLSFFLGACVLSGLALVCLMNPPVLLYFIILASAVGSLVQDLGKIDAGSADITVSGVQWLFVAGICTLTIGLNLRRIQLPKHFYPFLFFVLYTLMRWGTSSFNLVGMKDLLFYSLPFLVAVYTLFSLTQSRSANIERIGAALLASVVIPVFLLGLLAALGQIDFEAKGPTGLVHPRPAALHLLVIVALAVAQWRYGSRSRGRRWGALVSVIAAGTILLTLSRMASLTALLLLATFRLHPVRSWTLIPQVLVGIAVVGLILFQVTWFRDRSFFKADVSIAESWQNLNTAGRADSFWPLTIEHALQKPLFGWGLGGARVFLGKFGPKVKGKWEPGDYHPHNEYLQVFHDMGILGLMLMLVTWGALMTRYWRDWKQAHLSGNLLVAKWSMAATIGMAAVLFTILTDNTLHFASVMTPVFIIVACAELSSRPYRKAVPKREVVRANRNQATSFALTQ